MNQSTHDGLPIGAVLDLAVDEAGNLVALHAGGRFLGAVQPSFLASAARDGTAGSPCADEAHVFAAPEGLRVDAAPWDQRSDLYVFGIGLFKLLTGRLPFQADGAAGWRHAHLAVAPSNPSRFRPDVPPVLDAMVMRLLAKDPQERYQQAETLRVDLTSCREEWRRTGEIRWFDPAAGDAPHRVTSQGALFGRSRESARLRDVLDRVSQTRRGEILLVSGGGGVGKTSLVQRVLREMAGSLTMAAAKSDKLQRDNPYAPIAQVVRGLVDDVVAQGEDVLDSVRRRLVSSLDGHERLVVDLVPEARHVLGSVNAIADVPAQLERVRTQGAILRTLAAFLDPPKPLALFIDDIQWLDGMSRGVLDALAATAPEGLCLICAFRDFDDGRPFVPHSLIEAARAGGMPLAEVTLSPLDEGATAALVNSAFPGGIDGVGRLATMVRRRAAGNPFATHQALRTLFDEGSVRRDPGTRRWSWTEDAADRAFRSEGGEDVVATRLDRLPDEGRTLMGRMACIGRRIPIDLLEAVLGKGIDDARLVAHALVEAGLLVEEGSLAYVFEHDRTFEAAYSLLGAERRRDEHAGIARALLARNLQPTVGGPFEVANQIELAGVGPFPEADRLAFASALVAAAATARRSGGVDRALSYLDRATAFSDEDWWRLHPALAHRIHALRAELLLATASLPAAAVEIDLLLNHAPSDVERATARRLQAVMLTLRSDYDGAITAALMGLDALGIRLERGQPRVELDRAYATVKEVLGQRTIADLSELPVMTDARIAGAMAILSTLISSIFTPDGLRFLHMAKMVELTLVHGTTQESAYGLAWFGVMIASLYDDYEDGQAWAEVATALVERHGYDAQRTATLVALDQVSAWTRPMSYPISRIHEAIRVGHAAGDVGMTCYARNHLVSDLLIVGERLDQIEATVTPAIAITQDLQYRDIELLLQAQRRLVRSLAGDGGVGLHDGGDIVATSTRFWVRLYDGIGLFWDGRAPEALPLLREAADLIPLMAAHIDTAWCSFFLALALAGADDVRATSVDEILGIRGRFVRWAELNPGTFRNKLLLIDAEVARVSGAALKAMALYDQAADAAEASGFDHERALAFDLAGRHLSALGLVQSARRQFELARGCYAQWGAEGKADRVARHHGLSRAAAAPPAPRSLDLALALRVSQSMSEEIVLDTLVRSLVTDLVIHAGASHGALVMFRDGRATVEATGAVSGGSVEVQRSPEVEVSRVVPATILNVVAKTRKALVLADGRNEHEGPHATDRGVRTTRSLLCVPLLKRSMLVGLVYLENRLTGNVFTTDRTTMIELLASQAAISLENADLYGRLVEENRRRETTETALRAARAELGRAAQLTVLGGLAASVAHEVNQPLSAIATHADAAVRWLSREVPDLDEALQGVRSIRTGVDRATEIIRGLRALARQAPSTMVEFRIGDTVRHVLTLLEAEVGARGIELVQDLQAEGAIVRGDATQVEQVILNLVNNAVDVLAAAVGRDRWIRVRTTLEHGGIRIGVSDSGPGIQPELLPSIFDPLFTTKADGMGMGLAICRSIVEAHGGKLEVASSAAGTNFSFVLATVSTWPA